MALKCRVNFGGDYRCVGVQPDFDGARSDDVATVYFDVKGINADGTLKTGFNTFGQNPNPAERQILSLVITDTAGKGYISMSMCRPSSREQRTDNPREDG